MNKSTVFLDKHSVKTKTYYPYLLTGHLGFWGGIASFFRNNPLSIGIEISLVPAFFIILGIGLFRFAHYLGSQ